MSCIGLIRLVVCVLFTYVDRLVMKYLSASSCGDYLFICIKGLSNNIYHLTVVYSDLGATPGTVVIGSAIGTRNRVVSSHARF